MLHFCLFLVLKQKIFHCTLYHSSLFCLEYPLHIFLPLHQCRQQCRVLLVETHRQLTFIAVFTVHAKTSLLYVFRRSIQANRNVNLWQEKAPVYRLPRSKATKTQRICHYRHTRKTGELFLLFNMGVDFNLRNNFDNSGSFAKVSVPVHIYNSLLWLPICI